jgi:hypothetical protein
MSKGYRPSLYVNLENPPYMALIIEATPEAEPSCCVGVSFFRAFRMDRDGTALTSAS